MTKKIQCQAIVGTGTQCKRTSRWPVSRQSGETVEICQQHADIIVAGIQDVYAIDDTGVISLLHKGKGKPELGE